MKRMKQCGKWRSVYTLIQLILFVNHADGLQTYNNMTNYNEVILSYFSFNVFWLIRKFLFCFHNTIHLFLLHRKQHSFNQVLQLNQMKWRTFSMMFNVLSSSKASGNQLRRYPESYSMYNTYITKVTIHTLRRGAWQGFTLKHTSYSLLFPFSINPTGNERK